MTGIPGTVISSLREISGAPVPSSGKANGSSLSACVIIHIIATKHRLPYCVYILLSIKDDNFYVVHTTDLPRSLGEHFQGRNTSTAPRRPFVLVHCEYYLAKKDAERRENYLKTAKGRRVLRLMLKDSLAEVSEVAP